MGRKAAEKLEQVSGGRVSARMSGGLGGEIKNNLRGVWSGDPFGGEAIAREQDKRFDEAIAATEGRKLEDEQTSTVSGTTSDTSTQTTTFDPKSQMEQDLTDESIAAFRQQQALVGQQQEGIQAREGLQSQARDSLGNVLSGQAFNLSDDEQARIDAMRGANVDFSRTQIDEFLNERLAQVEADAASRGIRGQAFTQLQGDAIGAAARELNLATMDASRTASQQAIDLPQARAGLQAQTGSQFAGFADALQQQAIQNQQLLQDPVALAQARDERLRGGTTTSSNTQTIDQTTATQGSRDIDPTAILAAKAAAPGTKASKVALNQAGIGTAVDIAGIAVGAKG